MPLNRRRLVAGVLGAGLGPIAAARAQSGPRVAALFAGRIDDHGFMEAGYRGLLAARDRLGCTIAWRDGVRPERGDLGEALRDLARAGPTLVVAHGGQNNEAARAISAEFPEVAFAVTQGAVTGPSLASFEVLQEQSAFLAGALAAWSTKTGVIGHMSGIRVAPGLKGRAAYCHGAAHANPEVRVLTNFSGNQDDNALSRRVAAGLADARADVIFTMLNAGRTGAIEACRERGIAQIGNVIDWVAVAPEVFIGSAFADAGLAVFAAADAMANGRFRPGTITAIGLERPDAVRLTTGRTVPPEVVERLETLARAIAAGTITVPTAWSGPEFPTPA